MHRLDLDRKSEKEVNIKKLELKHYTRRLGCSLEPCGLEQVKEFQKVIPNYQICVVSKEQFNSLVYMGPMKSKSIYLLYNDHHYDLIVSMAAYLNRSYYCHSCKKGYNDKRNHRCDKSCHDVFLG